MTSEDSFVNFYELLGLVETASVDQIETMCLSEIKRQHPDRGGNEERAKQVNQARQVLTDPARRLQYDMSLRRRNAGLPPTLATLGVREAIESDDEISSWVALLEDGKADESILGIAVTKLAEKGPLGAFGLVVALKTSEARRASHAIRSLKELSIPALLAGINHQDDNVSKMALQILNEFPKLPSYAAGRLVEALNKKAILKQVSQLCFEIGDSSIGHLLGDIEKCSLDSAKTRLEIVSKFSRESIIPHAGHLVPLLKKTKFTKKVMELLNPIETLPPSYITDFVEVLNSPASDFALKYLESHMQASVSYIEAAMIDGMPDNLMVSCMRALCKLEVETSGSLSDFVMGIALDYDREDSVRLASLELLSKNGFPSDLASALINRANHSSIAVLEKTIDVIATQESLWQDSQCFLSIMATRRGGNWGHVWQHAISALARIGNHASSLALACVIAEPDSSEDRVLYTMRAILETGLARGGASLSIVPEILQWLANEQGRERQEGKDYKLNETRKAITVEMIRCLGEAHPGNLSNANKALLIPYLSSLDQEIRDAARMALPGVL